MRNILSKDILEQMIKEYHNGMDLIKLSEKYKFQEQTIQKHFLKSGIRITKGNAKKFSKHELENIINDYKNGMKPFELSKKYKRLSGTIIGKLKSIGLYQNSSYRFSSEDIEFLKKHYPIGDWESIYKRFPNVKKQSIHAKMSAINIHMDNYYWTKEDENILRNKYSEMYGHIEDLVDLFNNKYTYSSIVSKANKMGLKTRSFWSEDEISILKSKYSSCTIDEILTFFPNRSRQTIIQKAVSLGLTSKLVIDTEYSESERKFVLDNYIKHTDKELGKLLNRSASSVNNYRCRNGLLNTHEKYSYKDLSDYIRGNNFKWKKESMIDCNYKCILTHERFDDIHHVYSFNLILSEVLELLNITIKPCIDDYSKDELQNILDLFIIIQNKHPLGVCLTKEVHTLFHNKYGYGNNTQNQWNEFVKDYNNGKYSNELDIA